MSMQYVESGEKSFPISSSIAQYIRVKPTNTLGDSNTPVVTAAGVTDVTLGVTLRAAFTTTGPQGQTLNGSVGVRLMSAQGTIPMTANGAIPLSASALTPVYSAAAGKVSASQASGALLVGYALQAATADGDQIEVLPL